MSPTDRPTNAPCPRAAAVQALLLGRGPAGAADSLARHLPGCPDCTAAAEAIGLDSGVVSGLRRDDLPPPPSDRDLADVVARVSRVDRSSWAGGASALRPEIDLPGRLGPYRLVELLGAGGMGVVYRAEDTALHRFVAVKVVKGGADADTRARFSSEARALAAVRHDHVVTVYYVGEEPTAEAAIPYLAMELLEGQSLRDWMAGAPRPSTEWVVRAGRQIATGLAFVHDAGLVHRDIKPANLWLEAPQGWANRPADLRPPLAAVGRVKLLDFGLAHAPGVLTEGGAAGTPTYMAPEQIRGEAVDARTDLFGLGCVLYELCTGRVPFPERSRLWTGWEAPPPPVRTLNPAVPDQLAVLIERLLAANRTDRPESARAVERELASLDVPSTDPPTVSVRGDATVVMRPLERLRQRRLLVLTAALLVAAGAIAAASLINRHGPTSDLPDGEVASLGTDESSPPTDELGKRLVSPQRVDDEWCREVSTLPPQQQLNVVGRKLSQMNPEYDWLRGTGWVEPDGVVRYTINTDKLSDLSPLRALAALRVLRCQGSAPGHGRVTDLSPLSGLRLLRLFCPNNPGVRDLTPLRLDRLEYLDVSHTSLPTLAKLGGAPLVNLNIAGTPISNLGPVRRMSKLQVFDCTGCPVTDLEPLATAPLRELRADVRTERDEAVLKRIKTLESINGLSVREFWKRSATKAQK